MKHENLASQGHWDAAYEKLDFFKPHGSDPIKRFIKSRISKAGGGQSAFEVGCFPGRYLTVLGDLGYILHGIDLTPRVVKELTLWLSQNGYKVGDICHGDFFEFSKPKAYDLVCSFGFIEHFTNFQEVIKKHLELVAPWGRVIITTPNFSGLVQKALHSTFDKENLSRHHLPAMDPFVWKHIIEKEGFVVEYCGWYGGFDFWGESQGNSIFGKIVIKSLNLAGKAFRFVPINHKSFSPYSIVVARRQS